MALGARATKFGRAASERMGSSTYKARATRVVWRTEASKIEGLENHMVPWKGMAGRSARRGSWVYNQVRAGWTASLYESLNPVCLKDA